MAFEENEISVKSMGGTEMVKRGLAERLPEGLVDDFQIICSRVRDIEEDKIRVYWLHDLPDDPETNHLKNKSSRDRFHKLVFCGHWQYNQYIHKLNIPQDDNCVVIETPIDPIEFVEKPKDQINLIYTSTPQRGLELLFPVFDKLCEKHGNINLHVFSSFKIYGWDEADERYQQLFDNLKEHPKVTYHGFKSNQEVREQLQKSHILAYPSIWSECNSRSVIEAMSAGLMCVHPNLAGLSDTSGGLTFQYQFDQNVNKHANKFYHALDHAIEVVNEPDMQQYFKFVKAYADSRYNWKKITGQWEDVLNALKFGYPSIESRALKKDEGQMFHYVVR
ncbi:MAG: glycosyltransferase family 1 protein [Caulobacteraceae bacterium]|nr:glycosyltransferase family 1 protein [Caulobacteraceae bacterium]